LSGQAQQGGKLDYPAAMFVGDSGIREFNEEPWEEIQRDPRGLLLMWEPPNKDHEYIIGMDPSQGITGWSRGSRKKEDEKTDNGVIEVFRIDGAKELCWKEDENGNKVPDVDPQTRRQRIRYMDVQVAEFAAPCDAVEIARVAKVIGTLYRGSEEDQAKLIWEAWPGCGMLCTQELLRIGYGNLWHWEYIADVAEDTGKLGWRSTHESMKLLWYRARRHLMQENAIIRSKWLLEEYADAVVDWQKMRARADQGAHDDRMTAANLCFWAGHKWTYEESHREPVTESPGPVDFQRYAPVLGEDAVTFEDWREIATSEW